VTRADRARVCEALTRAQGGTSARIGVRIIPDAEIDAYQRAVKEFETAGLHMHEHRNAALILVAPNARRYAVIGDRASHERVGESFWKDAVAKMQPHFIRGDIPAALIDGIDFVGRALHEHFPQ
jgi:uncharacterized membrane protein